MVLVVGLKKRVRLGPLARYHWRLLVVLVVGLMDRISQDYERVDCILIPGRLGFSGDFVTSINLNTVLYNTVASLPVVSASHYNRSSLPTKSSCLQQRLSNSLFQLKKTPRGNHVVTLILGLWLDSTSHTSSCAVSAGRGTATQNIRDLALDSRRCAESTCEILPLSVMGRRADIHSLPFPLRKWMVPMSFAWPLLLQGSARLCWSARSVRWSNMP